MTEQDIEHIWKVASNNPNHDTNWHDPVVVAFARAIERQIGFDKAELWIKRISEAVLAEREACLNCYSPDDTAQDWADKIRARSDK
jgi:hypothetical protein